MDLFFTTQKHHVLWYDKSLLKRGPRPAWKYMRVIDQQQKQNYTGLAFFINHPC